ncbi:uncharacterized protein FTJAE_3060 [Fusarium tjaetaba]|uniref:Uncharacterized protein n=1 Tax=Fusarium tjaetaba TaxID=1567544 RepID=A0A8H5S4J2_9HYPO|nr:uncharacterized protein FTJAE_3060 [Fusarium tjaetaba]KAF5643761.1 hypothetical protein FTJAE_3060 [Fusarium tjaetaba]
MASTSFDHKAVNPLSLGARRAHMKAFFMHLGIWDSAEVARTREKCVDLYCRFLYKQWYTSTSQEYFEYHVDALVWDNFLKRKELLTKASEWPWPKTLPKKRYATIQVSATYRDWLRQRSHAGNDGDRGETNSLEAAEGQENWIPAATVVDGLFEEAKPQETTWIDPYDDPEEPLLVREDWGVHNWDKVDVCPLPDADLCEILWWWVINKTRPDPLTGPFELVLSGCLGFHDLVRHDFHRIATNKLIDPDIVICWRVKDGYPVSLVVSPVPSMEKTWRYKAVADARLNRENMDKSVPEIHAILTQPRLEVPLLIEDWVRREGSDSNTLFARTTLARNTWALFSIDDGLSWFDAFSAKNGND